MVRAKYKKHNGTHTLTVVGHANYGEYGKDIVCAGVSALTQALIGWLEETYHEADCIIENGEVNISCDGGEDVATAFYITIIGLSQIADSYPDHVQIDIIGLAD